MPMRMKWAAAVLILGLAGLGAACSAPATPPAKEKPATPKPITAQERVNWYQACWTEFNDKKWDEFKRCYAPDAASQQAGYGKDVTGADGIVQSSVDFAKAAPDVHGEGQLILVNGLHIASVFLLKGTNSGPLIGPDGKEMKATNKTFGLMFGHAIDLDPASLRVVKEFGVQDSGTFAAQLGLSKAPARPVIDQGAAAPTIVVAKNDATETANVEVQKAQLAAWNKHGAAAVDAFVAEDAQFHDMTSPKDMNKKQSGDFNRGYWKAFPDASLDVSSIWGAGDYVVTLGRFEGTNDGDFPAMKMKKTGKKVSVPFLEIDRIEAGKFKESWLFFDGGAFAAQLGLTGT